MPGAGAGQCNSKGQGPTYECGWCLYDCYVLQEKKWNVPDEREDTYWMQFQDCCWDAGSGSRHVDHGLWEGLVLAGALLIKN